MSHATWQPTSNEDLGTLLQGLTTTITILNHELVVMNQYNAVPASPLLLSIGQPFLDSIPDKRKSVIDSILHQTIETGETQTFEVKYSNYTETNDLEPLWYSHEVKHLQLNNGLSLIGIYSTNISKPKNNEAQSSFLTQLLYTMPGAVLIYDYEEDTTTFINQYMKTIVGYTDAELAYYNLLNQLHPEDVEGIQEYSQNVIWHMSDADVGEYDLRIQHKSGEWVWIRMLAVIYSRLANNHVKQILCVMIDINENKILEQQLLLTERRFRAVFENASDGMGISRRNFDDFDDQTIIDVNPAFCQILGYTREEILPKNAMDFVPEDEREALRLRYLNPEANKLVERRYVRKDGTEGVVESMLVTIPDYATNTYEIITFSRDITERKQLEQQLWLSERRFRTIFENSPDSITITRRHKHNYIEPHYIDVNPMASKIYGYSRAEILSPNWHWQVIIPPDEIPKVYERFGNPEQQRIVERRFVRKDGSEGWAESWLAIIPDVNPDDPDEHEVINISRDITERKQQEYELFEASQRFKSLADSLPAVVILIDTNERYLYVNKHVADSVGISQDDFVGLNITDVVKVSEDIRQWRGHIAEVLEARTAITTEFTIVYDGQTRHHLITQTPVFDEHRNIISILTHSVNLTEQYQREDDLRQAKLQLEYAIQTQDRFLANISHELRSPIHVMLGFADLLNEAETLSSKSQDYLNTMIRSGHHLTRLINDLLDASQMKLGRFDLDETSINLHQLLWQIANTHAVIAEAKGLILKVEIASAVPEWIEADATRVQQIVTNLVTNAIKFTDRGNVELNISVADDTRMLILEVLDTGRGIAEDLLDNIFDAFVSGGSASESSSIGLGLYIARSLVQLMNGKIEAYNRSEGGSIFHVSLPLKVTKPNDIEQSHKMTIPLQLASTESTVKVLIIDDMLSSASLLAERLGQWGFMVEFLLDGATLFDRLVDWKPDIILLDLYLPTINGFDLIRHIRSESQFSTLPIIAATASIVQADYERAKKLGCDTVLTKPINFALLAKAMSRLLDVEFIYRTGSVTASNTALSEADLLNLPQDWLHRMYNASSAALPHEALILINEIDAIYPLLASQLRKEIDKFNLSRIADLLEIIVSDI